MTSIFLKGKTFLLFQPALYRKKARNWITHQSLAGARKGTGEEQDNNDDKDEDNDNDNFKSFWNYWCLFYWLVCLLTKSFLLLVVLEADKEEEEEEFDVSFDNDNTAMPPKKEKKPAAAKGADTDSKLASTMKGMTIDTFKRWSMNFTFPFMIKEFIHNNRKCCTVELLVPTVDETSVRPVVSPGLEHLHVSVVVPAFFPEYDRIEAANFGDAAFHGNTSIATAHHNVVQNICTSFAAKNEVIGDPMKIKLPFKVEESIAHWELQLYHGNAEVSAASGDQQYFSLLKVDLISIERVFVKPAGGLRVVGSPNAADHRAAAAGAAAGGAGGP